MELSTYLKQLHKDRERKSLVAWAEQSGVSYTSLWRWLSGKSLPRDTELESALVALGADGAQRAKAFSLLEAARGKGVVRLAEKTGLPLLDRSYLLIALRERRGWSQAEAARRTEIPRPTLAHWESGANWPSADRLHTLCFHYGVRPEELFALTLPPQSESSLFQFDQCEDYLYQTMNAAGKDDVLKLIVYGVQLSQLAPINPEAQRLLCYIYLTLGGIVFYILPPSLTHYYQRQALKLVNEGDPDSMCLIAINENRRIKIPVVSAAPQEPISVQQQVRLGIQGQHVLRQAEGHVLHARQIVQKMWYQELAGASSLAKDKPSTYQLLATYQTLTEGEGEYNYLLASNWILGSMGDYETVLKQTCLEVAQGGIEKALFLLDHGRALRRLGSRTEAQAALSEAVRLASTDTGGLPTMIQNELELLEK